MRRRVLSSYVSEVVVFMIPLLQTDRVRASEKQKSTDKTPPSRRYFVGFVSPFWRLRQPKPPLSTNNSIDFVDQFH